MDAGTSAAFMLPTPEIGYQRPGLSGPAPPGPSGGHANRIACALHGIARRTWCHKAALYASVGHGTPEVGDLLIAARQPQNRVRGVRPDEIHKINHWTGLPLQPARPAHSSRVRRDLRPLPLFPARRLAPRLRGISTGRAVDRSKPRFWLVNRAGSGQVKGHYRTSSILPSG